VRLLFAGAERAGGAARRPPPAAGYTCPDLWLFLRR
jgi:hypothetical protein